MARHALARLPSKLFWQEHGMIVLFLFPVKEILMLTTIARN
jgi:hypothetical protein